MHVVPVVVPARRVRHPPEPVPRVFRPAARVGVLLGLALLAVALLALPGVGPLAVAVAVLELALVLVTVRVLGVPEAREPVRRVLGLVLLRTVEDGEAVLSSFPRHRSA